MNKAQTVALYVLAVGILCVFGGFIWFYSADVTGYSDKRGIYRYNCDDPRYFNDFSCARRGCLSAIQVANAVPPNYKVGAIEAWGDLEKVVVKGHLRWQEDAAPISAKRFSCTFANGHVVELTVDDAKVPMRSQ